MRRSTRAIVFFLVSVFEYVVDRNWQEAAFGKRVEEKRKRGKEAKFAFNCFLGELFLQTGHSNTKVCTLLQVCGTDGGGGGGGDMGLLALFGHAFTALLCVCVWVDVGVLGLTQWPFGGFLLCSTATTV